MCESSQPPPPAEQPVQKWILGSEEGWLGVRFYEFNTREEALAYNDAAFASFTSRVLFPPDYMSIEQQKWGWNQLACKHVREVFEELQSTGVMHERLCPPKPELVQAAAALGPAASSSSVSVAVS
eukprot:5325252-Prymnesium_polylepis.1